MIPAPPPPTRGSGEVHATGATTEQIEAAVDRRVARLPKISSRARFEEIALCWAQYFVPPGDGIYAVADVEALVEFVTAALSREVSDPPPMTTERLVRATNAIDAALLARVRREGG